MPPVRGGATRVPVGSPDQGSIGHITHGPAFPIDQRRPVSRAFLAEAAGAEASDLGRGGSTRRHRLRHHGRASAYHRDHHHAVLAEAFPFWPQPVDPRATASGTTAAHRAMTRPSPSPSSPRPSGPGYSRTGAVAVVEFASSDSGLHRAARPRDRLPSPPPRAAPRPLLTLRSPPLRGGTTTSPSAAPSSSASSPGVRCIRLIAKAREHPELGLAEQLIAGHLPYGPSKT